VLEMFGMECGEGVWVEGEGGTSVWGGVRVVVITKVMGK